MTRAAAQGRAARPLERGSTPFAGSGGVSWGRIAGARLHDEHHLRRAAVMRAGRVEPRRREGDRRARERHARSRREQARELAGDCDEKSPRQPCRQRKGVAGTPITVGVSGVPREPAASATWRRIGQAPRPERARGSRRASPRRAARRARRRSSACSRAARRRPRAPRSSYRASRGRRARTSRDPPRRPGSRRRRPRASASGAERAARAAA